MSLPRELCAQVLCGSAPFVRNTDAATLALLKKGPKVSFSGRRWAGISQVRRTQRIGWMGARERLGGTAAHPSGRVSQRGLWCGGHGARAVALRAWGQGSPRPCKHR